MSKTGILFEPLVSVNPSQKTSLMRNVAQEVGASWNETPVVYRDNRMGWVNDSDSEIEHNAPTDKTNSSLQSIYTELDSKIGLVGWYKYEWYSEGNVTNIEKLTPP
jgi:tRNA uridine 5-carbamoylmethylation protein Kti12